MNMIFMGWWILGAYPVNDEYSDVTAEFRGYPLVNIQKAIENGPLK